MALREFHTETDQLVMPAEEGKRLFDREAQRLLKMSGSEFLDRWDRGEYRDLPDTREGRDVMRVAYLIPLGRQQSR